MSDKQQKKINLLSLAILQLQKKFTQQLLKGGGCLELEKLKDPE
jgi:hypothetical protein